MKYESEIIAEILEKRGHGMSSLHYESECIETWIEETKGAYPKLCDYESEWLNYINENPIGEFPYETITDVTEATINNVVPYAYKSAILKGQTLVNISNVEPTFVTINVSSYTLNLDIKHNLQVGKKYAVIGEISEINAPVKGLCTGVTHIDGTEVYEVKKVTDKGRFFFTYNVTKEIKTFRVYIHGDDRTNGGSITLGNLMILEYQEGMENWDVPYFTGMQSVKMPVLTTTGKNLFDKNKEILKNYYFDGLGNYTMSPNSNNFIDETYYYINNINKITLSNKAENGSTPLKICSYDINKNFIRRIQGSINYAQIIPTDDEKYIRIGGGTDNIDLLQLEFGNETSYEPYKTNILSTSEDVVLRKVGDMQDTLDCLTGEVTEKTIKITFDGSENWKIQENAISKFAYLKLNNAGYRPKIMCDKLKEVSLGVSADNESVIGYTLTDDLEAVIRLKPLVGNNLTVEEVKEWLSQNKPTFIYVAKTESIKTVELTITNQDGETLTKLTPLEGTMHIKTDGNPLKPTVSMEIPVEAITQNLASFIEEE